MRTFIFFLFLCGSLLAQEIRVPQDYPTIKEAIVAANSGDTIIVSPGEYFENVNLLGKDILLTSNFHLTNNIEDVKNTIINGSLPTDPDVGSCVVFDSGETENCILKGFTLTQGTGTRVYNPSDDLYFRTGGGILINQSSPTITNNIIEENACQNASNVFSAGGGGIRMGFGQPTIKNNIIRNNIGEYAGGIMIAYCENAKLTNNLIAGNVANGDFNGGGGIYVDWEPIVLENNTIVNNFSGDLGGGIISTGTVTTVRNCIIYGNTATNGNDQIYKRFGGNAEATYSTIEGGFNGVGDEEGVIDVNPNFENDNNFILASNSPCIDAGNPDSIYNDFEDSNNPNNPLYPAQGTLRNDMGIYGGNGSSEMVLSIASLQPIEVLKYIYQNPYNNEGITIVSPKNLSIEITVYNFFGQRTLKETSLQLTKGLNVVPLQVKSNSIVVITNNKTWVKTLKLIATQ